MCGISIRKYGMRRCEGEMRVLPLPRRIALTRIIAGGRSGRWRAATALSSFLHFLGDALEQTVQALERIEQALATFVADAAAGVAMAAGIAAGPWLDIF